VLEELGTDDAEFSIPAQRLVRLGEGSGYGKTAQAHGEMVVGGMCSELDPKASSPDMRNIGWIVGVQARLGG
jgi:hypothetical protein